MAQAWRCRNGSDWVGINAAVLRFVRHVDQRSGRADDNDVRARARLVGHAARRDAAIIGNADRNTHTRAITKPLSRRLLSFRAQLRVFFVRRGWCGRVAHSRNLQVEVLVRKLDCRSLDFRSTAPNRESEKSRPFVRGDSGGGDGVGVHGLSSRDVQLRRAPRRLADAASRDARLYRSSRPRRFPAWRTRA